MAVEPQGCPRLKVEDHTGDRGCFKVSATDPLRVGTKVSRYAHPWAFTQAAVKTCTLAIHCAVFEYIKNTTPNPECEA